MSDDDDSDDMIGYLNMTGRTSRIKTSLAAADICNNILAESRMIGVKIVGKDLGCDNGKIYLIAFAKCDGDAFVFDLKVNPKMIENGHLKQVLETITVIKVMHGTRSACLTVYKEFHFQIQNVFDTELAHTIIEAQKLGCSPFQIDLPCLNCISQLYGCGLKNRYRKYINTCLKKNKDFFGHRPLSIPTIEFVAAEAAILVPVIFSNMDQMIKPCNRGLFIRLCSIRICAGNEGKLIQNKCKIKELKYKVKKLKEKLKAQNCSQQGRKPRDPLCKNCGHPKSLHDKKKLRNCSNSPKYPPQQCKRKTLKSCSGNPSTSGMSKKCPAKTSCSRAIQTNPKCPLKCSPSCPPSASSSHCTYPPGNCCRPQMEQIRCYGHTEDVPTYWQVVQVPGMHPGCYCLQKTHPGCSKESIKQSTVKCNCQDDACSEDDSSSCSSISGGCSVTTDDCIGYETDRDTIKSNVSEESYDCWSESEEEYDLC